MPGFVYLIEDKEKNVYKIGVTKNSNGKRINALQTGNSSELNLLEFIECEYPFRTEKMLHDKFSEKKKLNEWFELEVTDVANFKNTCNEIIKKIDMLKDNPFFMNGIK